MPLDRQRTISRSLTIAAMGRTGGTGIVAPRTKKEYARLFRVFSEWCRSESRRPMPATPETLAEYAFYLLTARGLKRSSAKEAITAIRYFHGVRGHPVPNRLAAWYVLRVADSTPDHVPRQARDARRAVLDAILNVHHPGTPTWARDRAVVALGYGALLNTAQIVGLDVPHVRMGDDGMAVRLPGRVARVRHDHEGLVCAVCTVQAWLEVLRGRGVVSGPLIRWVDKSGRISGTGERMAGHVKEDHRLSRRSVNKIYARLRTRAGVSAAEAPLPKDVRLAGVTEQRRRGATQEEIGVAAGYAKGSERLLRLVYRVDESLEQERER